MVTNMAVKTIVMCEKPTLYISKYTIEHGRMRVNVVIHKDFLLTVKKVVIYNMNTTTSVSRNRRVHLGVAASKTSSGNKHQVANAGGNITQINYYGSDYSQAHAAAQNNMDPEKFTKPLADIANGVALKSPTVEELGYSDRIMQITAGNSTITTQEAVNAVVAYGAWPKHEVGVGEAIDKQSNPGPACDRFYTLDSWSWTTTHLGMGYELPGALADLGVFGQNCTYHFLMRSGFCVHVQLNASKFHQGMMMVVAIPECQSSSGERSSAVFELNVNDFRDYPKNQLTLFPHQMINLRTNNSATLILPYMNASPSENALSHNYWTVFIYPVVPLAYSAGATTNIPVTVSIAPMYSNFSGLRNAIPIPTARAQGVPTFDVPGSGQFVTTIRNSGYPAFPDFEETPMHDIPGEVTNLLEVMQVDTFCNAGGNGTTLTIDVTAPEALGGRIAEWDMSVNSNFFGPTYLARCTRWFSNYRGSIKLTFMFCGSAMATGKFLIAYTPPGGNAPQTRKEAMLATHTVWDVGLQSSVDMIVPWISQTAYRYAHFEGNVLSYRGYITLFYQTHVVVPPDAPSTCSIVVLAAATRDFVCRVPTDSAYYQGLGDEIGKVVKDTVSNTIQTLDIKPVQGQPVQDTLTVTTGDSAALTAPETGATSATQAASTMETRSLAVTFSGRETDVHNFLSKYAMFSALQLSPASSTGFKTTELYFSDEANTQKAVRSKYRMFTYLRMGYDIVVVLTYNPASVKTNENNSARPLTVQMLYSPPGCPAPEAYNSPLWFLPTTPSVFQKVDSTPISLRIPFMGVASAYASFYNGYSTFNPVVANYGKFPGNYLGKLSFRVVQNGDIVNNVTETARVDIICYARPTNVRAFGPRPIVTLKDRSYLAKSKGRIEVVEEETDMILEQQKDGTERRFPCGKRSKKKNKLMPPYADLVPEYVRKYANMMWVAYDAEDEHDFHILPLSPTQALCTYHQHGHALSFSKRWTDKKKCIPHKVVWHAFDSDLTCIELDEPLFDEIPPLCNKPCPQGAWTVCQTSQHYGALRMPNCTYMDRMWVDGLEGEEPGTIWGEHWQYHVIRGENAIQPGWCGSPLICRDGICGIASVGDCHTESFFIMPGMVAEYQAYAPNAEFQGPAEMQGVKEWCEDIAKQAGLSFGSEAMNGLAKEAEKLMVNHALGTINWKTEMVKKVIGLIVKVICAMVLIVQSEDKFATCTAVGMLLGVDILLNDPFEWLKNKVYRALGIPTALNQGPSEWIKEFNAACTAAKGLEWIGQKISAFVDWCKKLFEKENPRRTKFMQQLEDLPILMEHIDKIMAARGKYPDDVVKKICNNMRTLKRGADVYGVERNAATQQIVKYYQKAMSILQSMSVGRVEPVGLLIHGTPGCGKSLATEIVGRFLTERHGGARPYSLPPDPKHFDGYAQQPVVIMDDLGQNPDGEDCKLLCQMISSTEFIVPMAALEEKGMAFTSEYVLASTNLAELKPPTVVEPKALKRRFYVDVVMEIQKDYLVNGKLDASSALSVCNHPATNYKRCCPLICGKAALFRDEKTGIRYTLDDLTTKLMRERDARKNTGSKLDALFQGGDDWFETDYDKAPNVLKTIDELKESGLTLPMPRDIADLLEAVNTPEVYSYCAEKGWVIPAKVEKDRVVKSINTWVSWICTGLSVLASIASLGGFFYMLYKIFAKDQGAYTAHEKAPLKKPELRRVAKTQGPDMEFVNKLFNQSLFSVKTDKGVFSGLGLYDNWILLPKHSQPDGELEMEGIVYNIQEVVEIENNQGSLELAAVKIDRPVKFRDIRKYIPDHFNKEKECMLAVNNTMFPRMYCPVGEVTMFGFLNLSYHPTYNTCRYNYPTRSGQCGGVIAKSGKIIAMHIGGDGKNGYGAILTKRILGVLEQGELIEIKKNPGKPINVNAKTQLHPSVFHDVFPGEKEPAALHPKDKRLEVDLEAATLGKYKGNKGVKITEHMRVAMEHYYEQIRPILPPNVTEPLTLEEVVYGIDNLEGLDLNTSAGFPYVTQGIKKRDLIPPRGEPLTKLQEALALNGYDLPFVTYLKDELRPKEKIRMGKTRLIECSSLNDTIRMKMVFGRLFQAFHQNNGTVTGSAVGCNPDVDWSRFYAEMGGQPLIAFDYSNYDASMEPAWFELLKELLKKIGFSDADVKLIDHINYSTHLFKDKIYKVDGGMPSGCSGTSIFNSINNNHIIRTLVLDTYKGIDLDQLRIIAYGDDVVATYPFQLDAQLLAEAGKQYGLTMTPPDKTSDFNETTWENVTFLKRKFVPDELYPFLVHPVYPMKEVFESARWTRSAAATEEHMQSLCQLAWHAGEEEYQEFVSKIRSVPVGRALRLPSYKVLYQQWLDQF